jgi:hypothetical protein
MSNQSTQYSYYQSKCYTYTWTLGLIFISIYKYITSDTYDTFTCSWRIILLQSIILALCWLIFDYIWRQL